MDNYCSAASGFPAKGWTRDGCRVRGYIYCEFCLTEICWLLQAHTKETISTEHTHHKGCGSLSPLPVLQCIRVDDNYWNFSKPPPLIYSLSSSLSTTRSPSVISSLVLFLILPHHHPSSFKLNVLPRWKKVILQKIVIFYKMLQLFYFFQSVSKHRNW